MRYLYAIRGRSGDEANIGRDILTAQCRAVLYPRTLFFVVSTAVNRDESASGRRKHDNWRCYARPHEVSDADEKRAGWGGIRAHLYRFSNATEARIHSLSALLCIDILMSVVPRSPFPDQVLR